MSKGDWIKYANEGALTWVALFTGKQVPAVRQGSLAETITGNKIDPWAVVLVAGFVGFGLWLATKK